MKNSKLSRGDYSVICQKCASSIGARYDYQPDYSRVSVSPGRDSLSTGERDDPAEAPPGAIPAENHEPDAGYHADAEDNFYRDGAVQSDDPDALYEPGNGYHTDDEIREDELPDEKLTVHLFGSSVNIPAPVRRVLPRLVIFSPFPSSSAFGRIVKPDLKHQHSALRCRVPLIPLLAAVQSSLHHLQEIQENGFRPAITRQPLCERNEAALSGFSCKSARPAKSPPATYWSQAGRMISMGPPAAH
ncbi:hypothetical protein [Sphingopyxis sp. BSNA05]|uniref:hypothetical protein n=1 Tax=Sphingopyxis sp. BSNA05 TaxID=1236614 RepID=UPI00349FC454